MDVIRLSRIDFTTLKRLSVFSLFLPSIVFLSLISSNWEQLNSLQLIDNDDYMRYYQFTSWIQEGNWYLNPIDEFNPGQGQIIHWSRLPDIPLAGITLLIQSWLGQQSAEVLAIIVVPFIYLVFLSLAVCFFTYRIAGDDAAKLSLMMVIFSPIITKFYPGSIDHHNIQLVFYAWIIALLPFCKLQAKCKNIAYIQGLFISLSIWVGMENLPVITILLFLITAVGYKHSIHYLQYCRYICTSAFVFTSIFIILNRPLEEFLIAKFDAISVVCLVLFGAGILFCSLSVFSLTSQRVRRVNKSIIYLMIVIVSMLPSMLFIPLIASGFFYNYPELLKEYWLDHVIEAKSIIYYTKEGGILNDYNYLLFIIPAIMSILVVNKNKMLTTLYVLFMLSLMFPIFWQVRTIYIAILIAIPLQAVLCHLLMRKSHSQFKRVFIILALMPITPVWVSQTIPNYLLTLTQDGNMLLGQQKDDSRNFFKIELLKRNNIKGNAILAPIDYGAPILALTDNKIIAAPYHRNIIGNSTMIEIFSSTNMRFVRSSIYENKFDYIMLGEDGSSNILLDNSKSNSFVNKLNDGNIPEWLSLIDTSSDGVKLYKVNQEVL